MQWTIQSSSITNQNLAPLFSAFVGSKSRIHWFKDGVFLLGSPSPPDASFLPLGPFPAQDMNHVSTSRYINSLHIYIYSHLCTSTLHFFLLAYLVTTVGSKNASLLRWMDINLQLLSCFTCSPCSLIRSSLPFLFPQDIRVIDTLSLLEWDERLINSSLAYGWISLVNWSNQLESR